MLLASNAESNKRTSALAMELAQTRQQTSVLFELLHAQVKQTAPAGINSAAAMNLQALDLPRRPGQNAGQGTELVQAPVLDPSSANANLLPAQQPDVGEDASPHPTPALR